MGFFDRLKRGLGASQATLRERMNIIMDNGPDLDDDFWDDLEEALILSDLGARATDDIIENLRDTATRQALPDGWAVFDLLTDQIAQAFTVAEESIFDHNPQLVLMVGVNGAGKTTTVGKLAAEYTARGRKVLMGSGDTFRAAAIEQLEVWSQRAGVEIVARERGSDPASVCYETIERAEDTGADLVLIDTAGRLHTSDDLMRELQKVVNVVRKRSKMPVATILVIDATTGQNGLAQAREFHKSLDLDGVIITKLDGTAKGGIAVAISHELQLPIFKIGVGESIEDLDDFDPHDFAHALFGDLDTREEEEVEAEHEVPAAEPEPETVAAPESDSEAPETEAELESAAEADATPVEPFSEKSAEEPAETAEVPAEPETKSTKPAEPAKKPAPEKKRGRFRDWWPEGL